MIVKCPNCLTQYRINTSRVTKALVQVRCPSCGKAVTLNLKKAADSAAEKESPGQRPTLTARDVLSESSIRRIGDLLTVTVDGKPERPYILIADEPRAFREFLRKSLEELGCVVRVVDDGSAVEMVLQESKTPHVIFMNVVLKHTLGFVLCERIKANSQFDKIKVVLIGAIFRIDRFRRDPHNLYGADDYIEEIIVKQDLHERMLKLLGLEMLPGLKEPTVPVDVVDHARRLARIIISDIVVYNQDRADQLILSNSFQTELADELQEGREYFFGKIPSDRPEINEIFQLTLDEFLKRRKRELTK